MFSFDSGLKMEPLQNFIYISFDIFRRMEHNELTELEAWMYFLGSDNPADILRLLQKYPFFQDLYQDIVEFRFNPKELISMYSEALRIMDENTVKYMIDELKAAISQKDAALFQKDAVLSQKDAEISQKEEEIERLRQQLAKYKKQ